MDTANGEAPRDQCPAGVPSASPDLGGLKQGVSIGNLARRTTRGLAARMVLSKLLLALVFLLNTIQGSMFEESRTAAQPSPSSLVSDDQPSSAPGRRALIIVDVQNDFFPGGSLAVNDAHGIIPIINGLRSSQPFDLVVHTQDWHPANHISFAENHPGREPFEEIQIESVAKPEGPAIRQILWPVHCVESTLGAAFHPLLKVDQQKDMIVRKGTNWRVDSYSGFFDNEGAHGTGLAELLQEARVNEVIVVGLALDYCVQATAADAQALGFRTIVVRDATRAVTTAGEAWALEQLQAQGVIIASAASLH